MRFRGNRPRDRNTAPFKGHLDMDENGYLLQRDGTHTNVPVFSRQETLRTTFIGRQLPPPARGCAAALMWSDIGCTRQRVTRRRLSDSATRNSPIHVPRR